MTKRARIIDLAAAIFAAATNADLEITDPGQTRRLAKKAIRAAAVFCDEIETWEPGDE